jgi:hypothetical protein
MDLKFEIHLHSMLKNTLQSFKKMILSKDNLIINLNIMPKIYI